jgi:hypothetical protein
MSKIGKKIIDILKARCKIAESHSKDPEKTEVGFASK